MYLEMPHSWHLENRLIYSGFEGKKLGSFIFSDQKASLQRFFPNAQRPRIPGGRKLVFISLIAAIKNEWY